jgi:hypothetical protein
MFSGGVDAPQFALLVCYLLPIYFRLWEKSGGTKDFGQPRQISRDDRRLP